MDEMIKMAVTQGIFAVLFVYLLMHVIKTNAAREERLLSAFEALAEKYKAIDDIKDAVKRIEKKIGGC